MKSIQYPTPVKGKDPTHIKISQEVFPDKTSKGAKSYLSIPVTPYKSKAVTLPPYKSYIGLKQNVLAENNRQLLVMPYLDDEQEDDPKLSNLWKELEDRFEMAVEERPRRLLQEEQSRKYSPYVEAFLEEIGCDLKDVLRWLLDPDPLAGMKEPEFAAEMLKMRDESCNEDFNREKKKWVTVLSNLPPSSDKALKMASLACPVFLKVCGFSLWHIASRSSHAQITRISPSKDDSGNETYGDLACRVCHL